MGSGLVGALGGAAAGFANEAAADRQRQFLAEENRRSQIGGFLQKIALDDTAHPYSRQKAVEQLLQLHQTPYQKPFKFDPNVLVAPAESQPAQTSTTPSQPAFTPPAPPPTLAGGAAGPPSIEQAAGSLPLTRPPAPAQQASYQPPPIPAGIFMTPEQQAQHAGTIAGGVASGTLTGQMEARKKALAPYLSELPPTAAAGMVAGLPSFGTAMTRTLGTGGGMAGELRAQGFPVPDNIPDNQWVNARQTLSGTVFTPAAAPSGSYTMTEHGAVPKQAADIEKEQRELRIWSIKNQRQFTQALQKQQTGIHAALDKSDYTGAKKILNTSKGMVDDAIDRMTTMDQNLQAALQGDQQAMLSLVANHIGMTLGAQKGARITRAVWDEAMQSAPWLQRVGTRFDDRGLLMGVTLSPEQMKQMVELGHEKVDILKQHVDRVQKEYDQDLSAKSRTAAKPPAPGGGGQGGYIYARDKQGKLHRAPAGTALPEGWKQEAHQ